MGKEQPEKSSRNQYFTKVKEEFPELLEFGGQKFLKRLSMRYGENPGYPAAFYAEEGASGPNIASIQVLQEGTKGLSYINVGDMDLGQRLVRKLTEISPKRHVCALIKHEMPSGVALGESPEEAFEKAWNGDPLSNFGSVDVFSYPVNAGLAKLLVESLRNVEVVYAPDFPAEALGIRRRRFSPETHGGRGPGGDLQLDRGFIHPVQRRCHRQIR